MKTIKIQKDCITDRKNIAKVKNRNINKELKENFSPMLKNFWLFLKLFYNNYIFFVDKNIILCYNIFEVKGKENKNS